MLGKIGLCDKSKYDSYDVPIYLKWSWGRIFELRCVFGGLCAC